MGKSTISLAVSLHVFLIAVSVMLSPDDCPCAASIPQSLSPTPQKTTFIIGSRNSQLALSQATLIQSKLQAHFPSFSFPIVSYSTAGDRNLVSSLREFGNKGIFTKELQVSLLNHTIDIAVHSYTLLLNCRYTNPSKPLYPSFGSLKDCSTAPTPGLTLAGLGGRDDPRDCLVFNNKYLNTTSTSATTTTTTTNINEVGISVLPNDATIGTSSIRRIAFLKMQFPNFKFKDIRGNLNTRLNKLNSNNSNENEDVSNDFDAIVLAVAGLKRLSYSHHINYIFSPKSHFYAAGQGALGIECRTDDDYIRNVLLPKIENMKIKLIVDGEWACQAVLEGGCKIPLGVCSEILTHSGNVDDNNDCSDIFSDDDEQSVDVTTRLYRLTAMVVAVDGSSYIVDSAEGPLVDSVNIGRSLGLRLVQRGARMLIDQH